MAFGYYFAPAAMTTEKYNETIRRLKKAGVNHPVGRTYHACFGATDKLAVFDVWKSQAAFDKFGRTLMPILAELGVDPGQPAMMEVHNVIVPPMKAAATAKKPARRAALAKRRTGKKR